MKKIIVSVLLLTLSACGWHLRGSASGNDKLAMTTPVNLVIVTKDDHSPLINALRQSLPTYKINEITDSSKGLILNLDRELLDKRTAGVGSDALTSAYELILRVDYRVSREGIVITPLDTSVPTITTSTTPTARCKKKSWYCAKCAANSRKRFCAA
jgi:LPS-assembly lipoprotein